MDCRFRAYGDFDGSLGGVDDDDAFAYGLDCAEGCAAAEESGATPESREGGLQVDAFGHFSVVSRISVGGGGWGAAWGRRQAAQSGGALGLGHLPNGGEVGVAVFVEGDLVGELLHDGGLPGLSSGKG